jgi:hypothetical protein
VTNRAPLKVRIYYRRLGGHVHVRVFAGLTHGETIGQAGHLTFRDDEWAIIAEQLTKMNWADRSCAPCDGSGTVVDEDEESETHGETFPCRYCRPADVELLEEVYKT